MNGFIVGLEDKLGEHSDILLKDRDTIEGNVVSCMMADMLLLDEVELKREDFLTKDGAFIFGMLRSLRNKGFYNLDEVTILSNLDDDTIEGFNDRGGWEAMQHQIDIINVKNFDTYIDILYRENVIIKMHMDGFNLIKPIRNDKGQPICPIKLMRKMTAEQVIDWYESRLTTYGTGYTSKILEEEEILFTDDFIASCSEGVENGVSFGDAGVDDNLEELNCFPFLSRQISGLMPGTTTMMGGFSSVGKSTWYTTVIMALMHNGRKVLIISNEEDAKKFKIKFIVWILAKYFRYFNVTKKKLMNGEFTAEDRAYIKKAQNHWLENYKGQLKFISINDADMSIVKKKIRENVLRHGYDTVLYDTFKIQASDIANSRTDLSLVRDSRELDKMAKKYNIIMMASVQLAESMRSTLFLSAQVLSNAKQIKEQLENLFLMRNVFDEELDPSSKYYCNPFRHIKVNDKWVEEPFECDRSQVWRMLFVEKNRNGANSSDNGIAYLLKYDGDHCIFREVAKCRPRHGEIR